MRLLQKINCVPHLRLKGRIFKRLAVRGIIQQAGKLLMIQSRLQGDYKFPGGGLQPGETRLQALGREILEETGAHLVAAPSAFGKVIEVDLALEPQYEVFRMTSYYYICQVDEELRPQKLDAYEAALDYQPAWVTVEEAWQTNAAMLAANHASLPRWTRRETFVLGLLLRGADSERETVL